MLKSGRVRLLVALVAATALHGLILFSLQAAKPVMAVLEPAMQVDLLPEVQPLRQSDESAVVKTQPRSEQKQRPVSNQIKSDKELSQSRRPVIRQQDIAVVKSLAVPEFKEVTKPDVVPAADSSDELVALPEQHDISKQTKVDSDTEAEAAADSDAVVDQLIPADIQQLILARVDYPMQARRHGWQGQAELRFNVSRQSIGQLTMLISSGYPLLDRAAQRGIVSLDHIPLSDGAYRLPVVFRLQ